MSITGSLVLLVMCVVGCNPSGDPSREETPPSIITQLATKGRRLGPIKKSQNRGRKVYEHYCQICHGSEGRGDGFNSSNLKILPRNFTDPQFWKAAQEEQIILAIAQGGNAVGKSILMPVWGKTLSEQQISDVAAFLRTLPQQAEKKVADSEEE